MEPKELSRSQSNSGIHDEYDPNTSGYVTSEIIMIEHVLHCLTEKTNMCLYTPKARVTAQPAKFENAIMTSSVLFAMKIFHLHQYFTTK